MGSYNVFLWKNKKISVIFQLKKKERLTIVTDKRGYPHIFLISLQKHMLWVLIRSASGRRF